MRSPIFDQNHREQETGQRWTLQSDKMLRVALGPEVLAAQGAMVAYQGAAGGLDPAVLVALERVVVGPTRPDLTLILDCDPELGLARARARQAEGGEAGPDRFEAEALAFHARLREAFRAIAVEEPGRCAIVDAALPADAVEAAIRAVVAERLPHLLPRLLAESTGTAGGDAA